MAQWFPVRKGQLPRSSFSRGQPQHRQAADPPDASPAERPGHGAGRQAQAGRNAPQVKARQHDILPPPAAAAAARAGKRKRLVPGKQGRGAGKIGAAAEIDL